MTSALHRGYCLLWSQTFFFFWFQLSSVLFESISLIWRRYHCRWRTVKLGSILGTYQWWIHEFQNREGGGVRRPWVRLRLQFFSPGSKDLPSLGFPRRKIREKHRWVYNLRGWRTGVYTVLEWENIVFWFKCINYHLFHKQEPFFSKLTFWNSNSVKNKQWNLLIKFRNWNHNILKFGNTLEIHQRMR